MALNDSTLLNTSARTNSNGSPIRRGAPMRSMHRSALSGERLPLFSVADDFIDEMCHFVGSSTAGKERKGSEEKPTFFGYTSVARSGSTITAGSPSRADLAIAKMKEYEDEERRELERIRDDYFMTFIHEFSRNYSNAGRTAKVPRNVKQQLYGMFFRKLKSYTNMQFLQLFGRGIRRSSLSAMEVSTLVAALYCIDAIAADDDLHTLVYPATGTTYGIENCPDENRSAWYAFMAAKHSFLNSEYDVEDFRLIYVKAIYDKQVTMPHGMQMTKALLDTAVLFLKNSPIFKGLSRDFYEFCVALEEQYFGECPENTIPFEYQRGEMVGSGAFGKVYRCVNAKFGNNVALKEIPLPRQPEKERAILVEVSTLKMLSHENIVKLQGYNIDREQRVIHILMEFCQHSLRYVIDQHGGLTASLIQHYSRQLLNGLAYLHSENVIHRDIKAANVLVDGSVSKLTDFGTAYRVDEEDDEMGDGGLVEESSSYSRFHNDPSGDMGRPEGSVVPEELAAENDLAYARRAAAGFRKDRKQHEKRAAVAGTPLFMAPELLKGVLPSEASDIWAFGCVVFEMITADYPWRELTGGATLPMPLFSYRLCQAEEPPQLPENLSLPPSLKSFLYACLNMDPAKRPSATNLLQHEFLKEELLAPATSSFGDAAVSSLNSTNVGEVLGIAGKTSSSGGQRGSTSISTTTDGFSTVGSTLMESM